MTDLFMEYYTSASAPADAMSENDRLAHDEASHVRPALSVMQLRTHARAAGYNPDQPAALAALACVAGVDTERLAAAFTGRAPLDRQTATRLARTLGVQATVELCAADYAAAQASRVWQDRRDDANVRR